MFLAGGLEVAKIVCLVEGVSERETLPRLLRGPLRARSHEIDFKMLGERKDRGVAGGGTATWEQILGDIRRTLRQREGGRAPYVTLFIDFFRRHDDVAPRCGDLPGADRRYECVVRWMRTKVDGSTLSSEESRRFIPYVQMHELEALLFSDPEKLASSLQRPDLSGRFREIADSFSSPEDIDDLPETHPKQRILDGFKAYQETLHAPAAAAAIGLDRIREQCHRFNDWVKQLEDLPQ